MQTVSGALGCAWIPGLDRQRLSFAFHTLAASGEWSRAFPAAAAACWLNVSFLPGASLYRGVRGQGARFCPTAQTGEHCGSMVGVAVMRHISHGDFTGHQTCFWHATVWRSHLQRMQAMAECRVGIFLGGGGGRGAWQIDRALIPELAARQSAGRVAGSQFPV